MCLLINSSLYSPKEVLIMSMLVGFVNRLTKSVLVAFIYHNTSLLSNQLSNKWTEILSIDMFKSFQNIYWHKFEPRIEMFFCYIQSSIWWWRRMMNMITIWWLSLLYNMMIRKVNDKWFRHVTQTHIITIAFLLRYKLCWL